MSQLSDASDPENTPHEYARKSGIVRDYRTFLAEEELEDLQRNAETGISDHSHLPQFDFGPEPKLQERPSGSSVISKEAATLLAWVSHEVSEDDVKDIDATVLLMLRPVPSTNKLKLELPLLPTDHETDCRWFARRDNFEIKLQDVMLPLDVVDDEKCEGLTWPARYWNIGPETVERIEKEKLQTTREALSYIQQKSKCEWTAEDEKDLLASLQTYRRVSQYLQVRDGTLLMERDFRTKH